MLAGLSCCEMLSRYPQSVCLSGAVRAHRGLSAAVCDPNPLRPFAQHRFKSTVGEVPGDFARKFGEFLGSSGESDPKGPNL